MSLIVIWMIQAVSWFLFVLGYKRAVRIGRGIGTFAFHVVRIRRSVVEDNLRHAFPEKSDAERRAIALGCYRHLGRIFIEILVTPRLSDDELSQLVRFVDSGPVDELIAQKKGFVICLGHLGNWELLGLAAGRHGYVFHAITKRLKGKFNERIMATRRSVFKELPPKGSFDEGVKVIEGGGALALIVDQHMPGPKAVAVDFFGRPAATSPSAALFSLRTGCPVWRIWMTLASDGVYEVRFKGPFPVPEAPTLEERLQLHTQAIAKDLEDFVREDPSQWFWVHRRWKIKPSEAGEGSSALEHKGTAS